VAEENPPKVIQCSLNSNGAPPKYKSGALPSRDFYSLANKLYRGKASHFIRLKIKIGNSIGENCQVPDPGKLVQ